MGHRRTAPCLTVRAGLAHGLAARSLPQDSRMQDHSLRPQLEQLWEQRQTLNAHTKGEARDVVEAALDGLDKGELRVAEPTDNGWVVHDWLKKAVLLSFRLNDSMPMQGGSAPVYDKV